MSSVLAAEGGYQEFTLAGAEWAILIFALLSSLSSPSLVGFVFLMNGVLKKDEGTPKMKEMAGPSRKGRRLYLRRQFQTIALILVPLSWCSSPRSPCRRQMAPRL